MMPLPIMLSFDCHDGTQEKAKEKAKLMFQNGKITLDEMRTYFPELSNEEIEEVKAEVMQLA